MNNGRLCVCPNSNANTSVSRARAQAVFALYVLSKVGSWFSFVTLTYMGTPCMRVSALFALFSAETAPSRTRVPLRAREQ
jgi:hypothetical protein